jgi:hypothetical protein
MLNVYDYTVIGHSGMGKLDHVKARDVCQAEGDSWLEQNIGMIGGELDSRACRIMRWSDWLNILEVKENLDVLWHIYHSNPSVRAAIRSDIEAFLNRRGALANLSAADWDTLATHELEELAVYMYQTKVSRSVNLYPGSDPVSLRPASPIADALPDVLAARQFVLFDIRPV